MYPNMQIFIWSTFLTLNIVHGYPFDKKSPGCSQIFDKHDNAVRFMKNSPGVSFLAWPNKIIPYTIDPKIASLDRDMILHTMRRIESRTCVSWIPRNNESNYVEIRTGDTGCYSHVGYSPYRGVHILHLQESNEEMTCMIPGIIAHELLHILGFVHEHTRPDRDNFINIHWENIDSFSTPEFFRAAGVDEVPLPPVCDPNDNNTDFSQCYVGFRVHTHGVPYDFGSVMHYGEYDFSVNDKRTLSSKKNLDPKIKIGQRMGLSVFDIIKINKAYQCSVDKLEENQSTPFMTTNSFNKYISLNFYF